MPISKIGSKGVKDAELTADDIAPGTITSAKIAPGTIANDRLANNTTTINGTSIALGASGDIVAGTDWQTVKTSNFCSEITLTNGIDKEGRDLSLLHN